MNHQDGGDVLRRLSAETGAWRFLRFGGVEPDPLNGQCRLDHSEHCINPISKRPRIVQDGLHGLMTLINAMTDATGECRGVGQVRRRQAVRLAHRAIQGDWLAREVGQRPAAASLDHRRFGRGLERDGGVLGHVPGRAAGKGTVLTLRSGQLPPLDAAFRPMAV
jgi:hypothetical protein